MNWRDDRLAVADEICVEAIGADFGIGDALESLVLTWVAKEDGGRYLSGDGCGKSSGTLANDLCALTVCVKVISESAHSRLAG